MKKVYLIGGLCAAGKTTTSAHFVSELKKAYPKEKIIEKDCDAIWWVVMEKLGYDKKYLFIAPTPKAWTDPSLLGMTDYGKYGSMEACVKEVYAELFADIKEADRVVLQTACYFLYPLERKIIQEFFCGYALRNFMIWPPYEQYLKNRSTRVKCLGPLPPFRSEVQYDQISREFLKISPSNTMALHHPQGIAWAIKDPLSYQDPKVIDAKWKVFNFPKDMKGKTFYELGCNCGGYMKKAKQQGAEVTGIDSDASSLDVVLDRIPDAHIILGRVETMDSSKRYDYILSASSFHWFTQRETVIRKVSQMTDYFVLELPILEQEEDDIIYKETRKGTGIFSALVSRGLLMRWLTKYFESVKQIGVTDKGGNKRPVFLSQGAKQ